MPRIIAAVLCSCVPLAALAAGDTSQETPDAPDGPWRIVLKQQLKKEKACDLNEVVKYQEIPLGDEIAIDARVSCIDGREYDVSRAKPHQKFQIRLCEPAAC